MKRKKKAQESATVRLTGKDKRFNLLVNTIMILLLIILIIPLWSTVALSFRPATFIGTYIEGTWRYHRGNGPLPPTRRSWVMMGF